MSATKKAAEQQLYSRNKLVGALLKIKHGDLSMYVAEGLAAAKAEPEVLAHLVAWNHKHGKVRDAKVALPPISLRGLDVGDFVLAENAVAHIVSLSPRDLLRSYRFSTLLSKDGHIITGGFRRMLEQGLKLYVTSREAKIKWWDKTVLQHRQSMKEIYRLAHVKPSPRAQAILFDHKYPANTVFAQIAKLKSMSPQQAAGTILQYEIPFEVVVGSVAKAKDKDIVLALLEGMTGNQVITNTRMLERFGVMKDPALKSAYEAALVRAKSDKKVETLKAGRAAERMRVSAEAGGAGARESVKTAESLERLQQTKVEQLGSIEGDWLVLGDGSGSMSVSIELARKIAGFITERVSGEVHLVFFDTSPTPFVVTGKTYIEINEMTKYIRAQGGTSIGCGLDWLMARGTVVNGIVIVSDGGDNSGIRFHQAYKKYVDQMEVEPTVYLFHVPGDPNELSPACKAAGIQLEEFEMGREVDYYSLPNIVPTLRANRYALFDEIMETPLLKLATVFQQPEVIL